ncbi:MAG: hypothetical protein ABIP55_16995 [Tepidisphaeraceae bacterium]
MACPLLAVNEPPQVGQVVHDPAADLHGGQLAGSTQIEHRLPAHPAKQPSGFTLIDQ